MHYSDEEQKEIFLKERDSYPEAFKVIRDVVMNRSNIFYKKGDKFIEVPNNFTVSLTTIGKDGNNNDEYKGLSWQINIVMRYGKPRLAIEVYDYKEMEYLEKNMPCLNYFPHVLLPEDYGVKWKIGEEI